MRSGPPPVEFGSESLDAASRLLAPYIVLFALYVLFHGHHSPGGGFQSGTILAAAVILVRLVRGQAAPIGPTRRGAAVLAASGAALYAGIGLAAMAFGGDFLDYSAAPLPLPAAQIRSLGILAVEIGVTIGVMGTMVLIFDLLSFRRGEPR